MERWIGGVSVASLLMFIFLGYYVITNYLATIPVSSLEYTPQLVVAAHAPVPADLFSHRELSDEEQTSLQTWNRLSYLVSSAHEVAGGDKAIHEASVAWNDLMASVEKEKQQKSTRTKEKLCPHFLGKMNASELDSNGIKKLRVPCGLTQGSSITFTGTPNGHGNFMIELTGKPEPGKLVPFVVLHYNVKIEGDLLTAEPVIVQNSWSVSSDWGTEQRCPLPIKENNMEVDELDYCNELVGKDSNHIQANLSTNPMFDHDRKPKAYFPFKQDDLFDATLRVGSQGFQMIVDGKHITSFTFRKNLEPRLVNEVQISGDLNLISVVAKGLPTSKDFDPIDDIYNLKAIPLPPKRHLYLFIGVLSSANYFRRRMAVRRSWMQYPEIRSGQVAARFFVGLHAEQMVNEELWKEARTYQDIQLIPSTDYYDLITWKTIATCIFGTDIISAEFIMKTDDDSFICVDEILNTLVRFNVTRGFLYGIMRYYGEPERNPSGRWYTSYEEWPEDRYPTYPLGPGYVMSHDIAEAISRKHKDGLIKVFKLEDASVGMWLQEWQEQGLELRYEDDYRIIYYGCSNGYVIAHYQTPRQLLCLWKKIQDTNRTDQCCNDLTASGNSP